MKNRPARNRAWFIVTLVLILAGVAAYVVGNMLGRADGAQGVSAAQAQAQTARAQSAKLQSVNGLLRAANALYRAAVALDNRNFGTASNHVAEAAAQLKGIDPVGGVDAAKVRALAAQVSAFKISVTADLGTQHVALVALAGAIDALVPPTAP